MGRGTRCRKPRADNDGKVNPPWVTVRAMTEATETFNKLTASVMPQRHRPLTHFFFAALMAACVGGGIPALSAAVAVEPATVLITGASRGIGFEFTRQYAEKGWTVIATCRSPVEADALQALAARRTNVTIAAMDVTDSVQIEALAEKYQDASIDVLLNNAGIFGYEHLQTLDVLDYDTFEQVMAVNVYGPLKVSQAFAESVAASNQKKIVTLTSGLGSMSWTELTGGGYYFYRASKAGVNIVGRALAEDLRDQGILIGLFNPGIVNTDFLKWTTYNGPTMEPEEAVAHLIRLIEELNDENNAIMINYDGTPIPW